MKVPPKRKGNSDGGQQAAADAGLNESPSEKEGKWGFIMSAAGRYTLPQ